MKIPANAKKVFEGVIYDVYHWDQKMFDGSVEVFEGLKRKNTVEVVATTGDNKVLIARQSQPGKGEFFCLFGGMQDTEGENPLKTGKRELLEESGFESEEWELLAEVESRSLDWTQYFFIAKNCKKVAEQKLDAGEKIEVLEVSFEELVKMVEGKNWRGEIFINMILRLKQDKTKLDSFKKSLFI